MASEVASKPCILLIRFEKSDFKSYRNSVKKGKSVLLNYGGKELAISPNLMVMKGDEPNKYGMGVLGFPTVRQAEMWLQSERAIGQQDWLGGIDILCVPVCQAPNLDMATWVINYPTVIIKENHDAIAKVHEIIKSKGCHFVAASPQVFKWRGTWSPPAMIVQQWASMDALKCLGEDEELKKVFDSMKPGMKPNWMCFQHEDIVSPVGSPVMQRKQ